jgi:hypothetical protein
VRDQAGGLFKTLIRMRLYFTHRASLSAQGAHMKNMSKFNMKSGISRAMPPTAAMAAPARVKRHWKAHHIGITCFHVGATKGGRAGSSIVMAVPFCPTIPQKRHLSSLRAEGEAI